MGFGKDHTGVIILENSSVALGALAGQDALELVGITLTDSFRSLKSDYTLTVTGLTAGQGAGLRLYKSQGALTAAGVEAHIETNGPTRRGDVGNDNIATDWVKQIGVLQDPDPASTQSMMVNMDGGPWLQSKDRWTFDDLDGWNYQIYNGGTLLTTGATARLNAVHYGVWVGA